MKSIDHLKQLLKNPYALAGQNDHATWCNFCHESGVSRHEIIPTQHKQSCPVRQAFEFMMEAEQLQNQDAYEAFVGSV